MADRWMVKFGDLYSTGRFAELGVKRLVGFGGLDFLSALGLTTDRARAFITENKELAQKHRDAWTGDAIMAGEPIPRLVKLKAKK